MARLPNPDVKNPAIAPYVEELRKARGGQLLNIDLALLHQPEFARASREFFRVIRSTFRLPDRLRELVILRVAVLNSASYEYHQHEAIARKAGISEEHLEALQRADVPDCFDELETLVIRMTDTMTQHVQVPDELFEEVRRRFDDRSVVELVATISAYNYLSRFLEALQIDVER